MRRYSLDPARTLGTIDTLADLERRLANEIGPAFADHPNDALPRWLLLGLDEVVDHASLLRAAAVFAFIATPTDDGERKESAAE